MIPHSNKVEPGKYSTSTLLVLLSGGVYLFFFRICGNKLSSEQNSDGGLESARVQVSQANLFPAIRKCIYQ